MEEKSGSSFSLILSGVVVLSALVGGAIWHGQALVSPRPESEAIRTASFEPFQTIAARMWQDPLGAVQKANGARAVAGEEAGQSGKVVSLRALQKAIKEGTFRSEDSVKPGVEILFCMIPGDPYAEETEARLRARHAVVSALASAGYRAEDEEHLGVLDLPWPKDAPSGDGPIIPLPREGKDPSFGSAEIPFEWFRKRLFDRARSPSLDRVLLLWLPDTLFQGERVTPRLAQLMATFRPLAIAPEVPGDSIHLKILGPYGSSILRAMLPWASDPAVYEKRLEPLTSRELARPSIDPKPLEGVTMYSWSATAMDDLLVHGLTSHSPRDAPYEPRTKIAEFLLRRWGLEFKNVIATDEMLVNELLEELALRNVDLRDANEHVALISEWDTFYGRNIPVAFTVALAERRLAQPGGASELSWRLARQGSFWEKQPLPTRLVELFRHELPLAEPWPGSPLNANVHPFACLRGIDGKLPGDKRESKETARSSRAESATETLTRTGDREMNRPEGQNQLDYIPRLGDQLQRLDRDVRRVGGKLRAIGVLGSDFYDKLLILQSLRAEFPEKVFFTTDLDARFLQPEFLKSTRNVVVASGFGLNLNPRLQEEVPPFRNSYQTSLYFASLCALGVVDPPQIRTAASRRFEIGRYHTVDLSVAEDTRPPVHPILQRTHPGWRDWIFIALTLVTSCWLLTRIAPTVRAHVLPAGRCRLVSQSIAVRPSDLIDPVGALVRSRRLRGAIARLGVVHNFLAVPFDPATRLYAAREALVLLFNRRIEKDPPPPVTRQFLPDCRLFGHWLVGLWHTQDLKRIRSRAAARLYWESRYPHLLQPAGPRLHTLTGELRKGYLWAAVGVATAVIATVLIFVSHLTREGEPFSLLEGTSIWPSEGLRLMAIGLSVFFIGRALHGLEKNRQEVCVEFGLPRRVTAPLRPPGPSFLSYLGALIRWRRSNKIHDWAPPRTRGWFDAEQLWADYQTRGQTKLRFIRPLSVLFIYLLFGISLVMLGGGFPQIPARGGLALWFDRFALWISVLLLLQLTFMVVDATRLCRVFVLHLISETRWPAATRQRLAEAHGVLPEDIHDPWIDVQVIARCTVVVSKLVWYPFIILALMIMARSRYFDGWDWPPALVIIFIVNSAWAFSSAILLGITAKEARAAALLSLRNTLGSLQTNSPNSPQIAHIEKLQKEVEETREGAFRPALANPALKAALLPFTGGGLSLLLDFLTSR